MMEQKERDDNAPPAGAEQEDRSKMITLSEPMIMSDYVHAGYGGPNSCNVPQLQVMLQQLQKEVDRARSKDRKAMAYMKDLRANLGKVIHENEDLVKDVTKLIGTCKRTQRDKLDIKQTLKETQEKYATQQRQQQKQQQDCSSCCKNCTNLQLKKARERGLWQQEKYNLQELLTLSETRVKRLEFLLKTPHRLKDNENAAEKKHINIKSMANDSISSIPSSSDVVLCGEQGTCISTAQSCIAQSFQASSLGDDTSNIIDAPFPRIPAYVSTRCLFMLPDRVEDDEHDGDDCVASVVRLPPLELRTHFVPDSADEEPTVEMHRPRSNATKHKSKKNKHQQQTRLKNSASGPALSSYSSSLGGGRVGTSRTSTSYCGSTSTPCSNNKVNMNNATFETPVNTNGNKKVVEEGAGTGTTCNSRCQRADLSRSSASRFRESEQEQDGNDKDKDNEEPYDGAPNMNAITCTDKHKTERTSRRRNSITIRPDHRQHEVAVGRHGITDCEQDSRSPSAIMKKSVSGPALSRQEHDQVYLLERNGIGKGKVSSSSSASSHDSISKSGNAASNVGSRNDRHHNNNKKRTTSMFSLKGAFSSTGMLHKASSSSHATLVGYKNAMLARKHKPSPTLFTRHQNRDEKKADERPSVDAPSANTHNMSANADARASGFDKLVQEAQQSLFGVSTSPFARGKDNLVRVLVESH
jgi:hypothetical protein